MLLLPFIVGIVGNVTAILVQLSPLPTFWIIMRKKTTGSYSPQPYLFSLLSGMLWTYYGILNLKHGGIPIITISSISAIFQVNYIALYLWFGSKPQRIKTIGIFISLSGAFASIVLVSMRFGEQVEPIVTVGIVCIVAGVLSNAAPLTIMHKVIKTRSVEYMPFALSLCLFLNGSAWLAYALILKDIFLLVPNAIGVTLGAAQLGVYAFYKNYAFPPPPEEQEERQLTKMKDGCMH
ncbi:hypothetical protein GOP47_0021628 [Adiantum capillus-veneris]|uniref:Bidirectional sugar transporter SWEET n=1 Tax=Adiantum capillus-veneris TaxID=13818 RepID=A0A9D4U7T4_ADICA|nr:hypothetical protein GOP47_0021628 [Adiantum capillus-veneris]